MVRNAQVLTDAARIVYGIAAAASGSVAVVHDAQAHGDAGDAVPGIPKDEGGDGRIDTTAHGDEDFPFHAAIFFLLL
jgi:hypothetical protein